MNPILQAMIGKSSNNLLNQLASVKNPNAMFNQLMNTNPQFRQFVDANRNKSPEQIAQDYGVDISQLKGLMR